MRATAHDAPRLQAEASLFIEAAEARADVDEFVELVGRDERDGSRVRQADCHRRWQRAMDDHQRLVLMAPPSFGKSSQLLLRILWLIGRNPDLRVLYATGATDRSAKFVTAARSMIDQSTELRRVFPNLAKGAHWTAEGFSVSRGLGVRHDSLRALSPASKVLGDRADLILGEDLEDSQTASSAAAREKLESWWRQECLTRLSSSDGSVVVSGVPFSEHGLLESLARDGAYHVVRDPAVSLDGKLLWPERWDAAALAEAEKRLGRSAYEQMFLLRGEEEGSRRFRRSDLLACCEAGRGLNMPDRWYPLGSALLLVAGIDPAFLDGDPDHGDESAIVVWAAMPNPEGGRPLRRLVHAAHGRFAHEELARRICDVAHRYRCRTFLETNGGAAFLRTLCKTIDPRVVIASHTTGRFNKFDKSLGIEGMVAMAERRELFLPSDKETGKPLAQTADLTKAMLDYVPGEHVPDLLMAAWIASFAIDKLSGGGLGWIPNPLARRR